MQAGPEGHAGIERQHDGLARIGVGPCRPHEERADADRLERRLPGLEPLLIGDLADLQLADRTEAERLQVPERVADASHADAGDLVVHEVRLHDRERRAVERLLDGHAVVAHAPEDLAHGVDRLRVGRDRDLEPADLRRVRSACGGGGRRPRRFR